MNFTDRHVLITGASSGIGLATAAKVVSLGGRVTMIARRADELERAQKSLGSAAGYAAVDVEDKAQIGRASCRERV